MEVKQEFTGFSQCGDNKLNDMYGGWPSQDNSWTSFDDDAENFLLNFPMYVQIAATDIYMVTQNCTQNTVSLQNWKYLLNLKQDLWEHLCSCRPLTQGHWVPTPIHWNSYFYSYTCEKTCGGVYFSSG